MNYELSHEIILNRRDGEERDRKVGIVKEVLFGEQPVEIGISTRSVTIYPSAETWAIDRDGEESVNGIGVGAHPDSVVLESGEIISTHEFQSVIIHRGHYEQRIFNIGGARNLWYPDLRDPIPQNVSPISSGTTTF